VFRNEIECFHAAPLRSLRHGRDVAENRMLYRIHSEIGQNGTDGWYWEVHVEIGESHRVIGRGVAETANEARAKASAVTIEATATRQGDPDIKRAS